MRVNLESIFFFRNQTKLNFHNPIIIYPERMTDRDAQFTGVGELSTNRKYELRIPHPNIFKYVLISIAAARGGRDVRAVAKSSNEGVLGRSPSYSNCEANSV